ncbi:type VII secretion-associated serine protease mycosin [Actinoplanes derwentensis]|uniref:Type VII secretion-associated serine protease mycosin n=1 Tax=Actinoplanes derwentensis TaxID=113562 RepID=A0A1H2C8B5_9ACTN|nr:type VII secretion-associated serine protease mycosin [Actinoplanes derwentensis]GID86542.1 peptidase S8 [Actinoplanes derwentensis]SDT66512.1 type VII secretion-associated serine protease mycosin [Actinoplanes derwentensis]
MPAPLPRVAAAPSVPAPLLRVAAALLVVGMIVGVGTPAAAAPVLPEDSPGCLQAPQSVETGIPWPQSRLGAERAWPLTRGDGVTVAIVDTGIGADSPQLRGRVMRGVDLTKGGSPRADNDCFGHGTFIAGIIGAAPAAGTGFTGVAPGVRLLPVRVANSMEDGTAGLLAKGVRAAVDAGADVVNISASTSSPEASLVAAIRYAEEKDVVVVAAAANGAQQAKTVAYPAALPTVLAVGAIDASGALADFSQQGKHLGLTAPGVDVVSVGPGGPGHWQGSGTSYAVPFVVGVAALVRAYRPKLTAAEVRHRLIATSDHPALALPDPGFGWGVVNPSAAVSSVLPEEDGTGGVAAPLTAVRPDLPPPDPIGPTVAALGAGLAIVLIGMVCLLTVLMPAGHRRGWRPARVAEVRRSPPP